MLTEPMILAPISIVAIPGQRFIFPIAVPEGYKIYSKHDCSWLKKDLTGTPDSEYDETIPLTIIARNGVRELTHHATIVVRKSFDRREEYRLPIDSMANGNESLAAKIDLPAGDYVVIITDCCAYADGKFGSLPTVMYNGGSTKFKILSYGSFNDQTEAREAYIGMAYTISHTGGAVLGYFTSYFSQDAFGVVEIKFIKKSDGGNHISVRHDAIAKEKPIVVLEVDNQEFIIFRYRDNWISWPTFDRTTPISFDKLEYKCKLNPVMSLAVRNKALRNSIIKSEISMDDILAISDAIYFLEA